MRKYLIASIFIVIILVGFFLRFYKLGSVPNGLHQDETAIGYNAYSILKTGEDEHGVKFPLYFKSFNDYKLPVYIYMTSISEEFFGLTPFAVRFPSAFLGSLTIVAVFFLIKIVSKSASLALISSGLLAINPWHLFFSRIAFEVNVAVSFLVFGALCFFIGLQKKHTFIYYVLSILSFAISLYTYNVTRVFAPVLLLTLVGIYHKRFFDQSKIILMSLGGLFVVTLLPFIITFAHHSNIQNQQYVLLTGGYAKANMLQFRSYLVNLPHVFTSVFFNTYFLLLWQYIGNIAASLSTLFFFKSVGDTAGYVGVENVGMFYPVELLTIIIGIVSIFQDKSKEKIFFICWALFAFLLVSISAIVPVGTRNFPVVIPLVFFSASGVYTIFHFVQKKYQTIILVSKIILLVFIGYGFLMFEVSYYFQLPIAYAKTWRVEDKSLALYLSKVAPRYSHIIIDRDTDFIYTSLVFYQQYDPLLFRKEVKYQPDQLFTGVDSIGKYEYRKINWQKDQYLSHTLFVVSVGNHPANFQVIKLFNYPTRPVVISNQNEILQFPVTDIAYEIVTKK